MSEIKNLVSESSDEFSDVSDDCQESASFRNSEAIKKARIERAKKNANIWTNYEENVSGFKAIQCLI